MKRHRRLTVIGATAAGLIIVAAITGGTSASASTSDSAKGPAGTPTAVKPTGTPTAAPDGSGANGSQPAARSGAASVPAQPTAVRSALDGGSDGVVFTGAAGTVTPPAGGPQRSDGKSHGDHRDATARQIARVKAAVLKKYPRVTITSVTPRDDHSGGWIVRVTAHHGVKGTIIVKRDLTVGKLVPYRSGQHG